MKETNINISKLLYDSVMSNRAIIFSVFPLFIGYYLQDTVFTRHVAEITTDVPKFMDNATIGRVFQVLLPYVVASLLFYISNIISSKTLPKIELDVLQKLTDQLIESIKTSKNAINVNDIMIHIKKIGDIKNIYKITITYIIPTIIVAISLIYNFMRADYKTGLIVTTVIAVLLAITVRLELDSISNAYESEESLNDLYDEIHEIMANVDTVITSDTKEKEMDNIKDIKDKSYKLCETSETHNINSTYGMQALGLVTMIVVNYMSYRLYVLKEIDSQTLVSIVLLTLLFMDYYSYCVNAIMDLISTIGKFYETNTYFSAFKILFEDQDDTNQKAHTQETEEDVKSISTLEELTVTDGNIQFKNINLKYEKTVIFDKFDLKIKGRSKVAFVGSIGSGKTTLLKMLAGLTNYKGDIFVDDQNLRDRSYSSIVRHIAYISQHPKLFNKSILYNLSYGSDRTEKEIVEKLNQLKLIEFFDQFPNKLDTLAGKEGSKMSGGQRQFVAFIRAIVQNKSIILLDEPTSSLDQKSKQLLIDLINRIKDKTIIVSTHDKQLLPLFDTVIDINEMKKKGKSIEKN
jgi:ABC-type multidrug transport system fused ATPase/permease subunit